MRRIAITGVSRGIGRELARLCKAQGDEVTGTVRETTDDPGLKGVHLIPGIDVRDPLALARLHSLLEPGPIDVLINNAAIFEPDDWQQFDPATARRQFEINALAPIEVTRACLPLMRPASKIVMISSQAASIGNAKIDDSISYRMSKVALNMAGRVLANGLRERNIPVVMIHPGSVVTRMNPEGDISAELSARKILATIDRIDMSMSGTYVNADGEHLPW